MAIFDVIAGSVSPVEILQQWSAPAGTAISAGRAVYHALDTGWAMPCGSANPAEGVAITTTTYAGQGMTAVQKGLIDLGGSALTLYTYGTAVYVHGHAGGSAFGALGVAPTGGGTFIVGRVVPAFASHSGAVGGTLTADKLLRIDL